MREREITLSNRITEVRYEHLFTLGQYQNEKIGFSASVTKNENADQVLAALVLKVTEVEDCLEAYRMLSNEFDTCEHHVASTEKEIANREEEVARMKHTIDEIIALGDKVDVDERLRHACDRQTYKASQENLVRLKAQLAEATKALTEASTKWAELKTRIKKGNFSLEGLDLPKKHFWRATSERDF
jgi:chromosome segregation ATPase